MKEQQTSIKVAVRIRPLINKELAEGVKTVTTVNESEQQLTIGGKATYTFDHVFDSSTAQSSIYDGCVNNLVEGIFDGYNATVLAYGQTGSGKTHTMGTGMDRTGNISADDLGIVPRAVQHIFDGIESRKQEAHEERTLPPVFEVNVTFVELYNETILDLLDSNKKGPKISVQEDPATKEIMLSGVKIKAVNSPEDLMKVLQLGATQRTVATTKMNDKSSRSHAVFSIYLKQQRLSASADVASSDAAVDFECLTAKFHFVDLAGCESIKKTKATGALAREGGNINQSLLSLGNVINALANQKQANYRNSKLTRLLKDSLGGNSRTLMIACASPSATNLIETRNTMDYAQRAKEIKNKPIANQDKSSSLVADLRRQIAHLQSELSKSQKKVITEDVAVSAEGNEEYIALLVENEVLSQENAALLLQIQNLHETLNKRSEESSSTVEKRKPLARFSKFRGIPVKALFEGWSKKVISKVSSFIY